MGTTPRKREDRAWKRVLETHFRQFLAFYFPSLHRRIDWSYRPVSLDKELQGLLPKNETGDFVVDKLRKVRMRTGAQAWIFVHVEVQGRKRSNFAERIYTCRYRIFDLHGKRVVSLAVYTGTGKAPEGRYHERRLGDELTLRFPVAAIEDFRSRRKDLERSRNPFAAVTMAHLAMGRARTPRDRLRSKKHMAARLREQGYGKDDIMALHRFLDWLMVLPPKLEREYERHVRKLERRAAMPFLSNIEERAIRRGMRKGIEKGVQKGRAEILVEAIQRGLELRFGAEGQRLASRVPKLGDVDLLRGVLEALFKARSVDELKRLLPSR